ncbi:hypothetical protein RAS2_29630 [Phycisphaerae bacterium RAS2]|nr:hypothetical protein RAS2_29630 [Phycisphaerae bacterium RAS2]
MKSPTPSSPPTTAPLVEHSERFGIISEVVAFVVVVGFIALLGWFKLGDLDSGYHLAYGRHFLDTGKIVTRDPFIVPANSQDFVNANWGAQVVMAWLERAAGPNGLIALRTVLLAVLFAGVTAIARTLTKSWHAVAWAALLAALGAYERFSMRPELFSHALLVTLVAVLVRGGSSRRLLIGLGAMQVLWVNLHSYFLVGPLVTAAMLAGAALRRWRRPAESSRAKFFATLLAVQLAACMVNPWHVRGALFPISTLRYLSQHDVMAAGPQEARASAWSEISEFHSPFKYIGQPINSRTINAYLLLLALAAVGVVLLVRRGRLGEAFVLILLAAMSIQMRRNIAPFALIAAPVAVTSLHASLSQRLHAMRHAARTLSVVAALLGVGYWATSIVSGRFYYTERRITREFGGGYSDVTFPRDAVKWLADHPGLQPNLFVDYFSSSNTLLWLPERFKLFVDTNTFAYPEPVLRAAFDVGLGKLDHKTFLDEHGINVVLLHAGPDTQPLIRKLAMDVNNWSPVYFDPYAVIYLRRIPEHEALIQANQPREDLLNPADWIARAQGGEYHRALTLGTMLNVPMTIGWWSAGLTLADEAIRLAPDYHEAWYHKAVAEGNLAKAAARRNDWMEMRRRVQRAVDSAETVLKFVPDHRGAVMMRDDLRRTLMLYSGVGN